MRSSRITRAVAMTALCLASAAIHAAPISATVWNLQWTGALGVDGLWGISASSNHNDIDGTTSPSFDHVGVNVSISGELVIRNTASGSFTGADVIGLSLSVFSAGARIESFEFSKDQLKSGVISGTILGIGDGGTASLTDFQIRQNNSPFNQYFGCPFLDPTCGGNAGNFIVWAEYPVSGPIVPPNGYGVTYGRLDLFDGLSDPCCNARTNQLRFHYLTPDDALAAIKLTYDGRRDFQEDVPGLPSPVSLPGSLSLLLLGLAALSASRHRGRIA